MIEINRNPDRRQVRTFGLGQLAASSILAGWAWYRHAIFGFGLGDTGGRAVPLLLLGAGAICAVLAVASPSTLKPLFVGLSFLAAPIGFAVSLLSMAVLYYGIL